MTVNNSKSLGPSLSSFAQSTVHARSSVLIKGSFVLQQDSLLIENSFNTRASIQLFGHKHSQSLEKINNSQTAVELINQTTNPTDKKELQLRICRELARQNSKGVVQGDLHLGNFLLSDNKVYALDAGQIRFVRSGLARKVSISQLASLVCCFGDMDADSIELICAEYSKVRGWHFSDSDKKVSRQ